MRWAREREPVFYSPKLGYWVVARYDDIKTIFRDNRTFSPSIALEKITPTGRTRTRRSRRTAMRWAARSSTRTSPRTWRGGVC
ncbi:hypothetical protein BMMON2_15370 [Burkholderia mallei]